MPELPEVEITRRQLARWAGGRVVRDLIVADPAVVRRQLSSRPADAWPEGRERLAAIVGRRAEAPLRHGKRLAWPFGDLGLLVHLGMTGSWVRRDEPPPHGKLGLELDGWIWFVDPRRFGCVVPVDRAGLDDALRAGLGPDALEPLDGPTLAARFGGRGPIKPALLDQGRLAGVGNIQAIESLWRARVAPTRPGASLTPEEWDRLAAAIGDQLRETIAACDGDELRYTNLGGPNPFPIYDRAGAPCPRCGAAIERSVLGGRATYSCPVCQPA